METEKQTNYYVVNQFQANVPFLHPLKTAETLMFFSMCPWAKERKHWPKWVDNSGREIIGIRENAALIYGINGQNTTSASASNNAINGVNIFISGKCKGLCEWYFKSDIAEFEFDYVKQIKLKTFIDKNVILQTFPFSFLLRLSLWWPEVLTEGRPEGYDWITYFRHRFIDWW